jgi:hypothetical protein
LVGCGGNSTSAKVAQYNKENVQKSANMYSIYSSLNSFTGPADMEAFKEFMTTSEDAQMRAKFLDLDLSNFDSYVVGRDGEQLKFRWKVRTSPVSPSYPICFEETGVDGVRLIGMSGGIIVECDDEDQYEEMLEGKYRAAPEKRYTPGVTKAADDAAE